MGTKGGLGALVLCVHLAGWGKNMQPYFDILLVHNWKRPVLSVCKLRRNNYGLIGFEWIREKIIISPLLTHLDTSIA